MPIIMAKVSGASGFHIASLDGLRAVAIVIVFLSHAGLGNIIPGTFGVTVFFFLSGYLIATLLRLESERFGQISLKQFYLRRTFRIIPPLYLLLFMALALSVANVLPGGPPAPSGVLAQLLFCANYYKIFSLGHLVPGTRVLWSLAVEEHFYLVFPLFFVALNLWVRSVRRQVILMAGLCALVLVWRCVLVFYLGYGAPAGSQSWARLSEATDTRVDSILFGCMLAIVGNPALDKSRLSERQWKWILFPMSMVGLLLVFLIRNEGFRETFRYTLQGLFLFPVFITVIRFPTWGVARVLNWRWVTFIGLLSYTLYLQHDWMSEAVRETLARFGYHSALLAYGIAGVLSLLLSTAVYYAVELPFAALRKRISRVSQPVAAKKVPTDGPAHDEGLLFNQEPDSV